VTREDKRAQSGKPKNKASEEEKPKKRIGLGLYIQ
jgi:hypothetical protein